jgi:type II restriction/modification system DNA methylase subunit YeeA
MAQKITVEQFVKKWSKIQLKEKSASQSHFNDICALVEHATPTEADPNGSFFTFEADVEEDSAGGRGWADAWYKDKFIWEYKGRKKNLDAAYQQLLRYREALGNPPLLITCDMQTIIIHTNFNNTLRHTEVIDFDRLQGDGLQLLRDVFYNPEAFRPALTQAKITEKTADSFVAFTRSLQNQNADRKAHTPEQLAHFAARILFCLFAEDIKLLPDHLFTELVRYRHEDLTGEQFTRSLRALFAAMRAGNAVFGAHMIPWFDGSLFDDDFAPELVSQNVRDLLIACDQDWAGIDPSIFGTLFERIIDESKRAQLGAHYTSKEDILLVIEPVLMAPLRAQWRKVKIEAENQIKQGLAPAASLALKSFADEIAALRVLDPACGSGNFLYLALRELLDLQKQVIVFADEHGLDEIQLTVNPQQLYGLEINPYAHQLAQITVWIGYIQWRYDNSFAGIQKPILSELKQIEKRDAILTPTLPSPKSDEPQSDLGEGGRRPGGGEPAWPPVDVIIGNPPFLGGKRMRAELGDDYVDALFKLYAGRVAHEADLVCYWFEKARAQIENGQAKRAGLLATQGIRGGANRRVLERIKESGDIFWAHSDRQWVLDGAMVHVSMVGFDSGVEQAKTLDNRPTDEINPDLTSQVDTTTAKRLLENSGLCFQGPVKVGPFDIDERLAKEILANKNLSGFPNSDVVKPWMNGMDITSSPRNMWIIDFGEMGLEEAKSYKMPFEYVEKEIKLLRDENRDRQRRESWWKLGRSGGDLKDAKKNLTRIIVTPRVSKHRIFIWASGELVPDSAVVAIAREDDYSFGILHSKIHELWARRTGTQLREAESGFRYTPTSTFETFPFPWPPGAENQADPQAQAIAQAAKALDDFREEWLHPRDTLLAGSKTMQKRTLTNLYNCLEVYRQQIKGKARSAEAWKNALQELFHGDMLQVTAILSLDEVETLDDLHTALDHAVLDAYGWPRGLSDEQILEHLLKLNLERAK